VAALSSLRMADQSSVMLRAGMLGYSVRRYGAPASTGVGTARILGAAGSASVGQGPAAEGRGSAREGNGSRRQAGGLGAERAGCRAPAPASARCEREARVTTRDASGKRKKSHEQCVMASAAEAPRDSMICPTLLLTVLLLLSQNLCHD
jgi:hypothetical protein